MQNWVLDQEDGKLSSASGAIQLSPKSAAVLTCLIQHAGQIVSRNQILDEVWGDIHVSPDLVREYIHELRRALGDKASAPKFIETVGRRGFRLIGTVAIKSNTTFADPNPGRRKPDPMPEIQYCNSHDGAKIAHAVSGKGYPLLFSGSWMTHLELDWDSPSYGDYLRHLSERFQVIRYDQRGNGLSQWHDLALDFEPMVDDMEVVMDAYGFDNVAILGMSQGASVSIAYAIRHPERVSHLILNGGYARGRKQRGSPADHAQSDALVSLIQNSWGNENPAIRQTLTTLFMPDATQVQMQWFNEFQRQCGPADNIARFRSLFDDINVAHLLPQVTVPTHIIHSDGDSVAPLSEGRYLADNIPGASFELLNSPNHMMFAHEPDFEKLISGIEGFVKG